MKKNNSLKKGDRTSLNNIKIGQKAKVVGIHLDKPEVRRHLLDMGITKGTEVLVKKIAPMGDPIDIELRNYQLCISKSELSKVEVELTK